VATLVLRRATAVPASASANSGYEMRVGSMTTSSSRPLSVSSLARLPSAGGRSEKIEYRRSPVRCPEPAQPAHAHTTAAPTRSTAQMRPPPTSTRPATQRVPGDRRPPRWSPTDRTVRRHVALDRGEHRAAAPTRAATTTTITNRRHRCAATRPWGLIHPQPATSQAANRPLHTRSASAEVPTPTGALITRLSGL